MKLQRTMRASPSTRNAARAKTILVCLWRRRSLHLRMSVRQAGHRMCSAWNARVRKAKAAMMCHRLLSGPQAVFKLRPLPSKRVSWLPSTNEMHWCRPASPPSLRLCIIICVYICIHTYVYIHYMCVRVCIFLMGLSVSLCVCVCVEVHLPGLGRPGQFFDGQSSLSQESTAVTAVSHHLPEASEPVIKTPA